MKKLILFDLDGTLLDTLEDLSAAVNHALSLRGLPPHTVETYRGMVGHGVRNLVQQALEAAVAIMPDGDMAGKNYFSEGFPKNQFSSSAAKPNQGGIPCRFYHISTDEVYGALQMTHPEGIEPPFTTKASSGKHHLAYGEKFFTEDLKYQPHSPYSAAKASSDHFVRAFHDTYGMPTVVTNCSNNYGPYQFPEKLIPLFINNIRHRKPLPVYGKGENVRDWLYVEDHARAIDLIFHKGEVGETYNIGGFNEWKNIDIIKVVINTVDRLLGRPEGADMDLITYVTDRAGHDLRYAIDSSKLQRELGWEPSLQFEEGIERTVRWYLDNQDWMDNVTSGDYQKYYESMYKGR